MKKEFVSYKIALDMKSIGFEEPCFGYYNVTGEISTEEILFQGEVVSVKAPLYQQAINFLYICSNKQIDIELKGSDTYEERVRKINQGCEDLRNLQNNKSNQ